MLDRKCDFAAEYFDTISTDTHIDHMVIMLAAVPRGAYKNVAGPVHFQSLLDQNLFIAGGDTMRDHPCGATSRRRSRSRIVPIVKNHARMQAGFRIHRLSANEVKEFPAGAPEILSGAIEIESEPSDRIERTHGNHRE